MLHSNVQSGTVTFLLADLVNTTPLFDRLGDDRADAIVSARVDLLRESVADRGEIVKYLGDGLLVVFGSALDAVGSALAMQRAIDGARSKEEQDNIGLRVGIHAGEPLRRGDEYIGTPVIITVRLCGTADEGQIVVSQVVHALAGSRGGFAFRDLGARPLRGISKPVGVFEVLWNANTERRRAADPADERENARDTEAAGRRTDAPHATAVILFADIVDSTPLTERLGDTAFRERADGLDASLRAIIVECGGAPLEGKVLGDGVMGVFASARQAIDAACRCSTAGDGVELAVHLGVHAGDVIRRETNIYGGAVNLASRICDQSSPNEILVSATVRELARTSTGVIFDDRGEHRLKGVSHPVHIFAVRSRDRNADGL
ncbi:MAG: adenylate/guanylate cyclase domain-containing protein [Dehalococcoidia bacterium]